MTYFIIAAACLIFIVISLVLSTLVKSDPEGRGGKYLEYLFYFFCINVVILALTFFFAAVHYFYR